MKKFLLLASVFLFVHANAQPAATTYIDASYAGSYPNSHGTFTHIIMLHNNISNPLQVMLECDGYTSYYTVPEGGDVRAIIDYNGSKGTQQNKVRITILNANSPTITLFIKKPIMI